MTSPSTPGSTTEPTTERTAASPAAESSGCGCGGAITSSEMPASAPTASTSPCCGTQEAAHAAGACCDPAAKSAAVTAGANCCG